ncbi:hypothetical protein ASZ78_014016 [Callipepla squamata]|uniref:Fibronectin type-III domain-containing protein n=1 Tax=Callipepla squamata TaxID=9009 RepID=A0A226NFF7_CALSU|nr:hypothetical protein ASZ78_014016 [Callipepla squamata]
MVDACVSLMLGYHHVATLRIFPSNRNEGLMTQPAKHHTLPVTKKESQVILYWNNNLTKEETEKYSVKYILSYMFFNTSQERKERLQEKKKRIRLELHTGFKAKVKTQVFMKETEDLIKESGWTECTYRSPPEKLNPPINVSVSLENRSIKIHWKPPPTIGSRGKKCFKYQVKITDSKIVDVTEEKYEYPVLRPVKKCTAQVRAKKEVCITNKIWSDWSEPVIIYDERTVDSIVLSLTLSGLLVFLGSLLICVCRRYRFLEVVTMPFPSPTDKLTTWLATDETHHQKQNSMQMEMQSEMILRISEDSGDEDIQQHRHFKESEDL